MIIPVHTASRGYEVVVESGCLHRASEFLNLDRRVLIVTDEGVPAAYAQTLASQCQTPVVVTLPQGEDSKTLPVFEKLLRTMLEHGFDRADCVVAVGGGVVGDLAGFTAASYMRGICFYNIPTTVLSQVDSSIGGKTAVNLAHIKNIVGAFYQPHKVLVDVNLLSTLPARQMANGLAEAVKMALTFDADLFHRFETEDVSQSLQEVICRAIELKRDVVEADETEQGLRKVLNFGHTIGHGIESVEQEKEDGLYHGECVALGMLPLCIPDTRIRLLAVLKKLHLPTSLPLNQEAVYAALLHDKKFKGGKVTVVKVEKPGTWVMETVSPEALKELIRPNWEEEQP